MSEPVYTVNVLALLACLVSAVLNVVTWLQSRETERLADQAEAACLENGHPELIPGLDRRRQTVRRRKRQSLIAVGILAVGALANVVVLVRR